MHHCSPLLHIVCAGNVTDWRLLTMAIHQCQLPNTWKDVPSNVRRQTLLWPDLVWTGGWLFDELIVWALVTEYWKCDTCAQSSRKLWVITFRGVNRSPQNKCKNSIISVHFLCLSPTGNTAQIESHYQKTVLNNSLVS